jgi:hypothetical protein
LSDLYRDGIDEKTFRVAKENMRSKMTMALENTVHQVSHNGKEWLLYSKIDAVVPLTNLYHEKIAPITRDQLHHIIRCYFLKTTMSVCVLGNHLPATSKIVGECEKYIG